MLMTFQPRDYQDYAVNSIFDYFEKGGKGNPVVAMPTGTGKSIVISAFIARIFAKWPTQRVMMLTHVKELIEQNYAKLTAMWPAAPAGIFSAGLKKKQHDYPITFAGIQSCAKAAALFGHIDLIIIDECHLVSQKDDTSYRKFIADLKVLNPNLKVIGLSATPYRLGLGHITDGGIFTDVCCDMTTLEAFNWFIDEGYLAPLVPRPTKTEIDISDVAKRGGEFVEKQLQDAVNKQEITEAAIRETLELAHDRKKILVFATGVDHVNAIVDTLHNMGETAVGVHSKLKGKKDPVTGLTPREHALHEHKVGNARWLVNANVLTTGYDDPGIDCIVMLRPTGSPGLWVQMLGRGTRPLYAPGFDVNLSAFERLAAIAASPKQNCLVLDFAGNTLALGPVNDPVLPAKRGKGGGEPPVKFCQADKLYQGLPEKWDSLTEAQRDTFEMLYRRSFERGKPAVTGCDSYNHTSARNCVSCGAQFVFKPKITNVASEQELIRKKRKEQDPPEIVDMDVDKVVYAVHKKTGGFDSLKVTYHCGMRQFKEWVPAWHASNVKHKGLAWWKERTNIPLPATPDEAAAISDELKIPKKIRVWINKKYPEIVGHLFEHVEETA